MAIERPYSTSVEPVAIPARGHLRRCTFRRMTVIRRSATPLYDVECLHEQRFVAVPIGDQHTARQICDACEAPNIFRPDED